MHIILGGTGRLGSATARALLEMNQEVTVITRDAAHGEDLKKLGARIAKVDLHNVNDLRDVLRTGKRAFLLNPTAAPAGDTDCEERRSVAAIVDALSGSGLEKIVAQSTYGAFEGERCGDLTVLYELEQRLSAQAIPAAINRGGYYMSNWAGSAETVRQTGILPSFFPADFALPMVAPFDLGWAAAQRMTASPSDTGVRHVEGPKRYSALDVAGVLSDLFKRRIEVQEIPTGQLEETFRQFGFSGTAAASYVCMIRRVINGKAYTAGNPVKGETTLHEYLSSVLGNRADEE